MGNHIAVTINKSKHKEHKILEFYKDRIPIKPGGETIEDILKQWHGKYKLLEEHDGYMQWLFPSRKQKRNPNVGILTAYEAKEIRNTIILKNRAYRAFLMMLDFYGMEMVGKNEFQLKSKWLERLDDLNRYKHNFKRITRILKALRVFGYKVLMYHWLRFLAQLIYRDGKLIVASHSFQNYWVKTLGRKYRKKLLRYRQELSSKKFPS